MPNAPLTVAQARKAVDALETALLALESVPFTFRYPEGEMRVPAHLLSRTVPRARERCDVGETLYSLLDATLADARAQLAAAEKAAHTPNGSK